MIMGKHDIVVHSTRLSILIIAEGYEETEYLESLGRCKFWSSRFKVKVVNAQGIDRIANKYKIFSLSTDYHMIFVVCDTEKYPYTQFAGLRDSLKALHLGTNIEDHVVFFSNPNTMQIILAHFMTSDTIETELKTNRKSKNTGTVQAYTGVGRYSAEGEQRGDIFKKITLANSEHMLILIKDMSRDFEHVPSSNMYELFNPLHNGDTGWVEDLYQYFPSKAPKKKSKDANEDEEN